MAIAYIAYPPATPTMGTLTLWSETHHGYVHPKKCQYFYFEDPDFMLIKFTSNPPKNYNVYKKPTLKKGSGSYPNWSKLMKNNSMTF